MVQTTYKLRHGNTYLLLKKKILFCQVDITVTASVCLLAFETSRCFVARNTGHPDHLDGKGFREFCHVYESVPPKIPPHEWLQ